MDNWRGRGAFANWTDEMLADYAADGLVETADGEKIGKWAWKPLFLIIAANLLFGVMIGGLPSIEATGVTVQEGGPRKINPFFIPGSLINLISGHVTILKGYRGPSYGMVSACTTGSTSLCVALLATRLGAAQRTTTLNLALVPLYVGGTIGPLFFGTVMETPELTLADGAVAGNRPVVLLHDAVRDRQAKACAAADGLRGEERVVDPRDMLGWNANTRVRDVCNRG